MEAKEKNDEYMDEDLLGTDGRLFDENATSNSEVDINENKPDMYGTFLDFPAVASARERLAKAEERLQQMEEKVAEQKEKVRKLRVSLKECVVEATRVRNEMLAKVLADFLQSSGQLRDGDTLTPEKAKSLLHGIAEKDKE